MSPKPWWYGESPLHVIVNRTGGSVLPHMFWSSLHPSKWREDFGGGPEVVTPIHMAAISIITELRYMAKLKYRQNQQIRGQSIFWGVTSFIFWFDQIMYLWNPLDMLRIYSYPHTLPFLFCPSGSTLPAWLMLLAPAFIVTCVSISKNKWEA